MSPQLFLFFLSLYMFEVATEAAEGDDKTDLAWYYGDDYHSIEGSEGFSFEEFRTDYEYPSMPDYEVQNFVIRLYQHKMIKELHLKFE